MLKNLLMFFAATLFATTLNADNIQTDFCSNLPGTWQAATHIKEKSLCDNYNGCEHFDLVTIKKDEDDYIVTAFFSNDGKHIRKQSANFSCKNNKFTFKNQDLPNVEINCDAFNHCYMVFDRPLFTAELVKQ